MSHVANVLTQAIARSKRTLRDIGLEVQLKSNLLSMMQTGVTKIPLLRVPALAKAVGLDPAYLFRLCMAEYEPGLLSMIDDYLLSFSRKDSSCPTDMFAPRAY